MRMRTWQLLMLYVALNVVICVGVLTVVARAGGPKQILINVGVEVVEIIQAVFNRTQGGRGE
jgi:hypothetical protein